MLRQSAKALLPALIEYTAKMIPRVGDNSILPYHSAAIGEVWKALAAIFTSVAEDQSASIYCFI